MAGSAAKHAKKRGRSGKTMPVSNDAEKKANNDETNTNTDNETNDQLETSANDDVKVNDLVEDDDEETNTKKKFSKLSSDEADLSEVDDDDTPAPKRRKRKTELTAGVVYLSRPPRFMKPAKVQHLLSQYGAINHLFLQPEDASAQRRRAKSGGNRKTVFVEGWVEYKDKRVAKAVARSLNNTQVGGGKGNFFSTETWTMKYLKGFMWSHLTEKMVYERKLREQRLRLEINRTKKDNEFFLENLEQGKQIQKMEERKKESGKFVAKKRVGRSFRQVAPVHGSSSKTRELKTGFLKNVLGKSS